MSCLDPLQRWDSPSQASVPALWFENILQSPPVLPEGGQLSLWIQNITVVTPPAQEPHHKTPLVRGSISLTTATFIEPKLFMVCIQCIYSSNENLSAFCVKYWQ